MMISLDYQLNPYRNGFLYGSVKIRNKSNYDFDYIRFIIEIKQDGKVLFDRTIESHVKIYSGDLVDISIPAMENYFFGTVFNRDRVEWNGKILAFEPKPKGYECELIERLEQII
jgi:hypothetical protein